MTIRGKILKTLGWSMVGVGFYMITLGAAYDGESVKPRKFDDDIIDADFTIIED